VVFDTDDVLTSEPAIPAVPLLIRQRRPILFAKDVPTNKSARKKKRGIYVPKRIKADPPERDAM
jgi:hypothetical protein